jgi:hypothetical protein
MSILLLPCINLNTVYDEITLPGQAENMLSEYPTGEKDGEAVSI